MRPLGTRKLYHCVLMVVRYTLQKCRGHQLTVQVTAKVTVLLAGKVEIVAPPDVNRFAGVAGHTAPPALVQLATAHPLSPAPGVSFACAPLAGSGPLLLTTTEYVVWVPDTAVVLLSVLVMDRSARFRVLVKVQVVHALAGGVNVVVVPLPEPSALLVLASSD